MSSERSASKNYLVITGASKGIGLATAKKFLEEGYQVINLSRSPAPIDSMTQLNADLFDPEWGERVRSDLLNLTKGAEKIVIVHNAALQSHGGAGELEAEEFRRVMELNVVAPVVLNRLLMDILPKSSSIIYVGSTLSLKATANVAAYVTSKHAIVGLMRSTCQDLAGTGIHTACVCPGFTNTEMLRSYGGDMLEILAQRSTQQRLVEPDEIANSIYFCATNPVVNGTVLRADLGLVEQ